MKASNHTWETEPLRFLIANLDKKTCWIARELKIHPHLVNYKRRQLAEVFGVGPAPKAKQLNPQYATSKDRMGRQIWTDEQLEFLNTNKKLPIRRLAKEMGVNFNTMRYKMRQIRSLSGPYYPIAS